MSGEKDQQEIVAFLDRAEAYGPGVARVERVSTHISHIFLAGDRAYKLKRAVRLPYLDFTSPALRREACLRELELNRRTAPKLYDRVAAITRATDGTLALDGGGRPIDWVVVMRRFDRDCLLDRVIQTGALGPETSRRLGEAVATFHAGADPVAGGGGAAGIAAIIDSNEQTFAHCPEGLFAEDALADLHRAQRLRLRALAPLLDARRDAGKVRRCHGDLHLKNICLIDGWPILFDCIEFSDAMSTIDVLYDLAFLLMDLIFRELGAEANAVLNRYLDLTGEDDGLAALPLFLSVRAAIRAHVDGLMGDAAGRTANAYLALAARYLKPAPPRLVAIGGLSGTGKSTLAYRLAPALGGSSGARVLRTDVIRKRLFGVAPETRLAEGAYAPEVTARVYASMARQAVSALAAGQSVIADAVFSKPAEREAIAKAARDAGVPFTGLWLDAPFALLEGRIDVRQGDASDADLSVLRRQAAFATGAPGWTAIDGSGPPDAVQRLAAAALTATPARE